MANLSFIGTGLMGAAMVEAMRRRGHTVTAWNRTLEKARALEKFGVRVATTPEDAVRGAQHVHIMLSDDAAVDAVLSRIGPALEASSVVLDHTTVAPAGVKQRAAWCGEHQVEFLHAPVFMTPQACRDATGLMLCSGPQARFDRVRPALEKMTGEVWYLGERVDLAAAYKLFGNAMIFAIVGGLADVLDMGASLGVDARDLMDLFKRFKPANTIDFRGPRMANLDFKPSFELSMARKDIRLMLEAAGPDAHLTVLPRLVERMDLLLARGFGHEDLAILGRDAVVRSRKTASKP
jgi:3-hydroxyisobutyrate dehydrogenase-like beta-hydroxyacid dehydrogenase